MKGPTTLGRFSTILTRIVGTRRGGTNEYLQSMFEQEYEKYQNFFI